MSGTKEYKSNKLRVIFIDLSANLACCRSSSNWVGSQFAKPHPFVLDIGSPRLIP